MTKKLSRKPVDKETEPVLEPKTEFKVFD